VSDTVKCRQPSHLPAAKVETGACASNFMSRSPTAWGLSRTQTFHPGFACGIRADDLRWRRELQIAKANRVWTPTTHSTFTGGGHALSR
jgi:hypothetical protein